MNRMLFLTLMLGLAFTPVLGKAAEPGAGQAEVASDPEKAKAASVDVKLKMTAETLEPLVRDYAFRTTPKLVRSVRFKIEEYDVAGLWDTLRIQLFLVHYLSGDGRPFNEKSLMYHNGMVRPFAIAFGGHGPMSAVLVGKSLYYTYSCGSGLHRSHVGCLSVDGEEVKIVESEAYCEIDLFVKVVGGRVQVEQGEFVAFNSWKAEKQIGSVKVQDSVLTVVDATGTVVSPRGTWKH